MSLIGLKIQYTSDIVAVVIYEDATHVTLEMNGKSRMCVKKSNIDWKKQVIDAINR